ncbi:hypothetical protein CXB51_022843 [Gossypium anomalum]|uniref:Uncharacterized protein n=1 Tax=Gossypium anomalum TaxID=47600 RepID=A0A8J5YLS1_9ROSI|nr:hypothetical protein CXB51_022843 [Gossypium anomalum]
MVWVNVLVVKTEPSHPQVLVLGCNECNWEVCWDYKYVSTRQLGPYFPVLSTSPFLFLFLFFFFFFFFI